jgi:hypothetical protein
VLHFGVHRGDFVLPFGELKALLPLDFIEAANLDANAYISLPKLHFHLEQSVRKLTEEILAGYPELKPQSQTLFAARLCLEEACCAAKGVLEAAEYRKRMMKFLPGSGAER